MRRAASGLPFPPCVKTMASTPDTAATRVAGVSRSPRTSSAPGRSRSARAGSRTSARTSSPWLCAVATTRRPMPPVAPTTSTEVGWLVMEAPPAATVARRWVGMGARTMSRSRSVDWFDAGEPQLFDVDAGLDPACDGVVDGALATQREQDFALAVQERQPEPAVLLVPGERRRVRDGHLVRHGHGLVARARSDIAGYRLRRGGAALLVACFHQAQVLGIVARDPVADLVADAVLVGQLRDGGDRRGGQRPLGQAQLLVQARVLRQPRPPHHGGQQWALDQQRQDDDAGGDEDDVVTAREG